MNFGLIFAISVLAVVVVALCVSLLLLWWVKTYNKPVKFLFIAIKNSIYKIFDSFNDVMTNNIVKTVYSNKKLNYSGLEEIPVPNKKSDEKFDYEFMGWEKCGYDENGNIFVKPIYKQTAAKIYINVFNDDKVTCLGNFVTEYGAGINLNNIKPTKKETNEFTFEFVGWDKEITAFFKNENVYACFVANPKMYTYKFLDQDGESVIASTTAIYGTPILAPANPVRKKVSGWEYEFVGWKGLEENAVLTKDCSFVAMYNSKRVDEIAVSKQAKKDKTNEEFNNVNYDDSFVAVTVNNSKIKENSKYQKINLNDFDVKDVKNDEKLDDNIQKEIKSESKTINLVKEKVSPVKAETLKESKSKTKVTYKDILLKNTKSIKNRKLEEA